MEPQAARRTAGLGVNLYWLPLGAGDSTHLVALSGRVYEHLAARRDGREPRPLFHSALLVRTDEATYAVEMAPVWRTGVSDRGVTGEGAVGLAWLGRSRWFRYEVRRWRDGCIPDLAEAVDGPQRLSMDEERAVRLLGLVPEFPRMTWGRDEQGVGDMWNSNSLTSWVLVRSGHDTTGLCPPNGGRAPGWDAGVTAANRHNREPRARTSSPRVDRAEAIRTLAALPAFAAAPLHRSRHLRWGAADEEVHAAMPGDDLVPRAHFIATRGVTIDAPPEQVWPWLVQVGYGRAGFYSYDLLDGLGRPSARTILPEWQEPQIGDLAAPMTATAIAATSFTVTSLSKPSYLVWSKPGSSWAWQLVLLPGDRTRLVTRLKQRYAARPSSLLTIPLLELGDFPMMRRMLIGLKERSEMATATPGRRVNTHVMSG